LWAGGNFLSCVSWKKKEPPHSPTKLKGQEFGPSTLSVFFIINTVMVDAIAEAKRDTVTTGRHNPVVA
jgi:hypothetical protein